VSLADKYDTEYTWEGTCVTCGKPVTMSAARWEVLGEYHLGCFGYPACSCKTSHQDDNCEPLDASRTKVYTPSHG